MGRGVVEEGATGVGGLEGRKSVGRVATEEIIATVRGRGVSFATGEVWIDWRDVYGELRRSSVSICRRKREGRPRVCTYHKVSCWGYRWA